jgi:hypothetical protein
MLTVRPAIGNQAMLRLLSPRTESLTESTSADHHEPEVDRQPVPSASWDFSKIAIFAPKQAKRLQSLPLQRELTVGAVNDPLEEEADRVADQVMRIPNSELFITAAPLQPGRKCAACEAEGFQSLRTNGADVIGAAANEAPRIVREAHRSPQEPLDPATRAFFEPRFGHDVSDVRTHTDAQTHDSTRAVGAIAHTVGRNIASQEGKYQPYTAVGQALLAHELTHTIQQRFTRPILPRAGDPLVQSSEQSTHNPVWHAPKEAVDKPAEKFVLDGVLQREPDPDSDDTDAFPLVNAELVLDPAQHQRCCTCGTPPCVAHLGPAVPGDPTAQNGMNLVATLLHTIASSSRPLDYGFVQVVQARRCLEFLPSVGGGWENVLERPPGSNDVFDPCATCTTPRVTDGLPEIVFSDSPGIAIGANIGDPAFGNQIVQRGNFATWVIAREGRRPWRRISEPVRWHSLSWMRRDAAGNWELNPGHNQIGLEWTRFGAGCPP